MERLFVLKTLSRTQRATKVKKFVGFSLKPLRCRDPALPPLYGHAYSRPFFHAYRVRACVLLVYIRRRGFSTSVLFIDFVSVLFPLFLVVMTYVLIELHARDFRIVVCCWKPFHSCFASVRRNWSASDSIIHAFASLLLLSFTTLSYNAYDILKSMNVYNVAGDVVKRNVLFNHPSTHWYTHKYAYYSIVVLLLLFLFGICLSLLLLLHPIQIFRVKLQRCYSQRLQITINTFVDTIQSPFKNGCDGTRDFRIVPGLIACLTLFFTTLSSLAHIGDYSNYLVPIFVIIFAVLSILTAYIQPCKLSITNLSITFHFMWLVAIGAVVIIWVQALNINTLVLKLLTIILVPVPHILMLIWILYKVAKKVYLHQRSIACFHFVMGKTRFGQQWFCVNTPLLPDRLLNSHNYRELS